MLKLKINFGIIIAGIFYLPSFVLADVVVLKSGKQVEVVKRLLEAPSLDM